MTTYGVVRQLLQQLLLQGGARRSLIHRECFDRSNSSGFYLACNSPFATYNDLDVACSDILQGRWTASDSILHLAVRRAKHVFRGLTTRVRVTSMARKSFRVCLTRHRPNIQSITQPCPVIEFPEVAWPLKLYFSKPHAPSITCNGRLADWAGRRATGARVLCSRPVGSKTYGQTDRWLDICWSRAFNAEN